MAFLWFSIASLLEFGSLEGMKTRAAVSETMELESDRPAIPAWQTGRSAHLSAGESGDKRRRKLKIWCESLSTSVTSARSTERDGTCEFSRNFRLLLPKTNPQRMYCQRIGEVRPHLIRHYLESLRVPAGWNLGGAILESLLRILAGWDAPLFNERRLVSRPAVGGSNLEPALHVRDTICGANR